MRGSKVAGWCGSFFISILMAAVFAAVIVCSAGQSFAGKPEVSSDAKVKAGASGLLVSVIYPPNGVLGSNQAQMIQVGVSVTPSPGTALGSYRLMMKMRRPSGHVAFSQQFRVTKAYSVLTLNAQKLAPAEYSLTTKLVRNGTKLTGSQTIIEKEQDPVPTPTATATATSTATGTATPTTKATATASNTHAATPTATPTRTATPTATATATRTATASVTATAMATATSTRKSRAPARGRCRAAR